MARGGEATAERMRLRCRAHNQYTAECTFGAEFMRRKREEARRAAEGRRTAAELKARAAEETRRKAAAARARAAAAEQSEERDVVPWLRQLGFRADEARRAAARCEAIPEASLEQRLRLALTHLRPPHRRVENNLVAAT